MQQISRKLNRRALRRWAFILFIKAVINVFTISSCAQTAPERGWALLEAGLGQKSAGQRLAAVRVLGLIPDDHHAAELAEKAMQDRNPSVRAAAATALGQMHASKADASLKQALNDKNLAVVMAAAHALRLLNDPACYDAYYEIYTGERKNDSGMIAQEMKVLHDPKQLAQMGFNEGIGFIPFAGIPWEAADDHERSKKRRGCEGCPAFRSRPQIPMWRAYQQSAVGNEPEPELGFADCRLGRNCEARRHYAPAGN